MKEVFKPVCSSLALVYCFFSLAVIGVVSLTSSKRNPYDPCREPLRRIEYLFPAFRVGCWLGEPVE